MTVHVLSKIRTRIFVEGFFEKSFTIYGENVTDSEVKTLMPCHRVGYRIYFLLSMMSERISEYST